MKKYIRCSISNDVLKQAIAFAEDFKGHNIDLDNHIITIPFSSTSTEELPMSDGMLGRWFQENGFDISFHRGDVEYTTNGNFNVRSMRKERGRTAYLRNRLIATVTW